MKSKVILPLLGCFSSANIHCQKYGIRLSHIFEIPSISNEKPSISIIIPNILIENLGIRSKYWVFQFRNFEILGFSRLEFEILGISKTWNFDFKF